MNRVLQLALAVGVVSLASVATAGAQGARFGVGGGLLSPLGDYKDLDKTGWHGLVRVDFSIPMSPVGIRVDGLYGQTSHNAPLNGDGNSKGIGGLVSLVWNIPVPAPLVKPYVLAGGGFFNVKTTIPSLSVDTSESKFAYGLGAGARIGLGPVNFFAEGRYVSVQTSGGSKKFVPLTVGVLFGGGKKK
ncbi:MAG TPA: outer membrane beta-barrel protein [Gemmatimonadales bacterium]|nr:outer membrane beta-barrel protein [Gemmatimonadales bacterium]